MTYIDFFKACALTSAAAPKLDIAEAGARIGESDEKIGINALEIRTSSNRRCVSYLSGSEAGQAALRERERAEGVLEEGLDLASEGVKIERALLGRRQKALEGEGYFVLICSFSPGAPSPLRGLSEEECLSFGKAVGAVHSKGPGPFGAFKAFSATSIRFELREWIERLRGKGSIPDPVLDAWQDLASADSLWDFPPSLIHGGWRRGEARFSGGAVSSLSKWERAQVGDPARDLEWMFEEGLAQRQADAFMQGYGMAMGDAMDPFVLPRAKLWRQMEMGAGLLEAQRAGEGERALRTVRELLRLSSDLRSIAPKKPAGPAPASNPPSAPPPKAESLAPDPPSSPKAPPQSGPAPQRGEGGKEKPKEGEGACEVNPILWQVAVSAALARREGRDLEAELEAGKAAFEAAKEPDDKSTSFFRALQFASDKDAPSLGAPVRLKEGGGVKERGRSGESESPKEGATAVFEAQSPDPPSTEPRGSATKVIEKIDGSRNE